MCCSIPLCLSTDGRKPFPINHGETSDDSFLEVGIESLLNKGCYTKFLLYFHKIYKIDICKYLYKSSYIYGWMRNRVSGMVRQNSVYSVLKRDILEHSRCGSG